MNLISVPELSKLTGLSHQHFYKLISDKKLPASKVGTTWVLDSSTPEVQEFINRKK